MLKTSFALIAVCFALNANANSNIRHHEIDSRRISGFCKERSDALFRWQAINGVRVVKIQESSHLEVPALEAMKNNCGAENLPIEEFSDSSGSDSAS